MSKLKFPTLAEQAVQKFNSKAKTVSLSVIAKKMGAMREYEHPFTIFIFEDDTSITVSGRGKTHKVETHLP